MIVCTATARWYPAICDAATKASLHAVDAQGSAGRREELGSPMPAVALIGGTGKLGSALAARFARAGHSVVIGSRDGARAERVAAAIERATGGVDGRLRGAANAGAASAADLVVITVPFDGQAATLGGIADAVADRVVVSTAVPVRFGDAGGPTHVEVDEGSASEQAAALLPGARVVGALHTVSSARLAKLDRDLDGDVLITGDDVDAKRAVAQLLGSLQGIRAVDAGPLGNSRYVEQLAVVLLTINSRVHRSTGVRVTSLPDELAPPS
jgi:hypothetical protein